MKIGSTPLEGLAQQFTRTDSQRIKSEQQQLVGFSTSNIKLIIDGTLQEVLSQMTKNIGQRQELVQALPQPIREATEQILTQYAATGKEMAQGLAALVQAQKATVTGLFALANTLKVVALVKSQLSDALIASLLAAIKQLELAALNADKMLLSMRQYTQTTGSGQNAAREMLSAAKQSMPVPPGAGTALFDTILSELARQLSDATLPASFRQQVREDIKQQLSKQMSVLSDNENTAVSELFKALAGTAPQIIKQAAKEQQLPELLKLWSLHKGRELAPWLSLSPEAAKNGGEILARLAAVTKQAGDITGEKLQDHSAMALSLPLYVGPDFKPYPLHLHVYHEEQEEAAGKKAETWLRICLETEHLGLVDTFFRLYHDNNLDVRIAFALPQHAELFRQQVQAIRASCEELPLNLVDITVGITPHSPR